MATTLNEGAQIINKALNKIGYDYQIDLTSDETITQGLEGIGAFPPYQLNALMEQMNLVIQQRNYGVMFDASKNKFREFLVDMVTSGFGIEDVFHTLMSGTSTLWDGNATAEQIAKDLVEYKEGDVKKFFHIVGKSRKFDTTVDTRNYEKVFTPYGVTRYIDTRLANLSWSAEYWLMQEVIGIIREMVSQRKIVFDSNHNVNNKIGLSNVVETIKSTLAGFSTPNALYNKGVYNPENDTWTPVINMTQDESYKFIVTTPEFMARLKTQGYANAFNLSQFELEGRVMYAPAGTDFGNDENGKPVYAVLLDRRAIVLGLKRWLATTFFVSNTGWTNHFLNVEILEGFNTIFNAVAISGEPIDEFVDYTNTTYIASTFAPFIVETDGIVDALLSDDSGYKNVSVTGGTYVSISFDGNISNYYILVNGVNVMSSLIETNSIKFNMPVGFNSTCVINAE